ncbi:uncharacterized protein F5147DRAFT_658146 [Suillus discolor]|uniref:Chromatin elongation factor SPT5 n=1 Tax=Suillus discolor TaxID=1912936 RepID=A0A9P7EVF6_9AGAM|nr:uncharacterized protein F5147DRAFT_658146 [Suillus discolor]KAG2090476.1 hypothetical protein F5147DRAFT_658146 [Suillus discolor]
MSKRTASDGDKALPKHHCTIQAYLGDRYSEDDWVEPRCLLFSGNADNAKSLENLKVLRKMYIPDPPEKSSMGMPALRSASHLPKSQIHKSQRLSKAAYKFILHEAKEDDENDEEEEEVGEVGPSARSPKAMHLPGPSAKQRLATTFDDMATWFEQNPQNSSSQGHQDPTIENGMYLLNVQRTTTECIAMHLQKKEFPVIMSAWVASQLYVVADSPKTITESLPTSLYLAMKDYICIMQEEREAVERPQFEFPIPAWVRIKKDKYRGNLAQVFENLPNGAVMVLIGPQDFPYPMPQGFQMEQTLPEENSGCVLETILAGRVIAQGSSKALFMESSCYQRAGRSVKILLISASIESHAEITPADAAIFRAPPKSDSIQIGDYIEVLEGEHMGRHGIVNWFAKGDTSLWFRDILTADSTELDGTLGNLRKTLQFMEDKGYDIRPGDVVTVTCGLEYGTKGVVQSIDFPNTCLTLLCDRDYSIITVPIMFVIKVCNANLDSCKKDIGQEVFIIGGNRKGFRAVLYGLGPETCTVAVHSEQDTFSHQLSHSLVIQRMVHMVWKLGGLDVMQDPSLSVNPISSTHQAWTIDQFDIQDNNDARAEKIKDSGAAIKHYHIPTIYLSPAPPRKKNQDSCTLPVATLGCSSKIEENENISQGRWRALACYCQFHIPTFLALVTQTSQCWSSCDVEWTIGEGESWAVMSGSKQKIRLHCDTRTRALGGN